MLRFQNDYSEGAHPNVLRALCDTNLSSTPGYGLDDDCRRAADAIRARFACPDADVHFLVGGTQTNQLAAAAFLRPWEAMVAADTGHINVHETGAIEATGHKVIAMPGTDGKLTPAAIADAAAQHCAAPGVYDEHMVLPRMAYISDATELGTVYTKAELTALRAACDAHGMYLYLDGARLAQALTDRNVPMYVPSPTNQIFPILSDAQIARLQEQVAFYTNARVDATHQAVRFVTSWATTDAQVDALLAVLAQVLD